MSETVFKREKKERNYTVLDNTFIKDVNLSWKAKGVMTYLLSLPDDWEIRLSEVKNHATDGKDSLYSAIKELKENGYLVLIKERNEKGSFTGKVVYMIYEIPVKTRNTENQKYGKPETRENRITENQPLLNTEFKENTKLKESTNTAASTIGDSGKKIKQETKSYPKEAVELAETLLAECKKVDSHFNRTDKQLESWAADFDKLNRIDGRDWEDIRRVLLWAKSDSFWNANILSASKFREKYPTLVAQMQRGRNGRPFMSNDVYTGEDW